MRTLYFDCFAGASGNMILGAAAGLGIDREELTRHIRCLDIPDFQIEFTDVDRAGISAVYADVKVPSETGHRHLHDIEKLVNGSRLSVGVKTRSMAIFGRLASAEARIHGTKVSEVHFHEVGALDAIIDVCGACIAFELLEIERFVCSRIHVGSGFVEMAHGKYPVPPPAVADLLRGAPIYSTEVDGELMTPTGAAIISTVCDSYGIIPDLEVEQIAYGAGSREYANFPNALRLMLGESAGAELGSDLLQQELLVIETNIDDVSPQIVGFLMERAFELGALDCWLTPIQMKKNRPAVSISILCESPKRRTLTDLLYSESTTIGVRIRTTARECLPRDIVKVATRYGDIDMKIARHLGKVVNAMPEYEHVKRCAIENGVAFRTVSDEAISEFNRLTAGLAANN